MKRIISLLISIMFLLNTSLAYTATIIIDGVRLEITRDVGETVTVLPQIDGIVGWEVKSGGVTVTNNSFVMPEQDVEIEAIISESDHLLTVENFGVITRALKTANSSVTVNAMSGGKRIFTNWTADGIVLTPEQETSQTLIFEMPDNAVTVVANYSERMSYIVSYDENAGGDIVSNMPLPQTKFQGENITLSSNIPTREGYTFVGWNTQSNGSGTSYNAGGAYSADGNLTLYAIWQINAYNVIGTVNPVAGGSIVGAGSKLPGDTVTLTASSNTGYNFSSWEVVSGGVNLTTSGTTATFTMPNNNVEIRANYELKKYTVSYNENASGDTVGNMPSSGEKTQGVNFILSNNTPTRQYHNFLGWNTESNGSGTSYNVGGTYSVDADLTLYAMWELAEIIPAANVAQGAYIEYVPTADTATISNQYTGYNNGSGTQSLTIDKNPSTKMKWKVYKNNSGQLDIISAESVGNLWLSGTTGYINAVYALNTLCSQYVNEYADSAVSIGSTKTYLEGPVNKASIDTTQSIGIIDTTNSTGYPVTYSAVRYLTTAAQKYPYSDTHYTTTMPLSSSNLLQTLRHSNTENVWIASRDFTTANRQVSVHVRLVDKNGAIGFYYLGTPTYSEANQGGVRPVVSLKTGVKIVGGSGTANDPYIIRLEGVGAPSGGETPPEGETPSVTTYTVSYNANAGSDTVGNMPSSQTKNQGQSLTLSSNVPTRDGYIFNGWNTASNGSGESYNAGGTYSVDANLTLYAKWTAITYTVTFNKNGGSGSAGNKTVTYGSTYGTLPTLTKTNYTFSGWYDAESGGNLITSESIVNTASNHTLYAVWDSIFPAFTYKDSQGNTLAEGVGYRLISDGGQNWRIKFLKSGKLTFSEAPGNVDVFVVGGGGAGASVANLNYGGAGGGGGYTNTVKKVSLNTSTTYSITVGAGGTTGDGNPSSIKQNSTTIASANGGKGAEAGYDIGTGGAGGSGGGRGCDRFEDFDGVAGASNGQNLWGCGTSPGNSTYEFGESSSGTLYAGGGGGAGAGDEYLGGSGGNGGHGGDMYNNPEAGEANTGGGGGGGYYASNGIIMAGASGGSGIVIIRNAR